jgi:hypothetical protein
LFRLYGLEIKLEAAMKFFFAVCWFLVSLNFTAAAEGTSTFDHWAIGSPSLDYVPSEEMTEDEFAALIENCARFGSQQCYVALSNQIVTDVLTGKDIGFANGEALYIIRQGLCPMERIPNSADRDAEDLACSLYNTETRGNLSLAFEIGLFGLPKEKKLASCWKNPNDDVSACLKLESEMLAAIPSGQRPRGFARMTTLP